MKRFISAALLLLALTLGGCGEASEPSKVLPPKPTEASTQATTAPKPTEPEPVWDIAPSLAQTVVTIDGNQLEAVYTAEGLLWVKWQQTIQSRFYPWESRSNRQTTMVTGTSEDARTRLDNTSAQMLCEGREITLSAAPKYDGEDWYVPLESLLRQWGMTKYEDTEEQHQYFTTIPDVTEIPQNCSVPALMYHAVSDNCWGEADLFVSPSELEAQLQYLQENGYTPIFFEDLPRVNEIEKPVLLTFDDGYDDNFTELFPILQKYQCKATVFVITDDIGKNHKLTAEQIQQMADSGLVSIQSHTVSHRDLDELDEADTIYELSQSQLMLTRLTGKQPFVLCYPTGYYSDLTLEIARKYYSFGLLMSSGLYTTDCDPFQIPRYFVSRYTSLDSFINMVSVED